MGWRPFSLPGARGGCQRTGFAGCLLAALLTALAAVPLPAAATQFESSHFRRTGAYAASMVHAWERGRSSAKASAFFLANRERRLLVMTATHVVGAAPVFVFRGRTASSAQLLMKEGDVAVYEVTFGRGITYGSVRPLRIAAATPGIGRPLQVVGFPLGFGGALMLSEGCTLLPRKQLLHPTFFTCRDLDAWCRYAEAAGKSRKTCQEDAEAVRRGRPRLCAAPIAARATRRGGERHTPSTHAMNCAARLGNSGGPVMLAGGTGSGAVAGMPSAVFARVDGPYPNDLGVGVSVFSPSLKARLRQLGVVLD